MLRSPEEGEENEAQTFFPSRLKNERSFSCSEYACGGGTERLNPRKAAGVLFSLSLSFLYTFPSLFSDSLRSYYTSLSPCPSLLRLPLGRLVRALQE